MDETRTSPNIMAANWPSYAIEDARIYDAGGQPVDIFQLIPKLQLAGVTISGWIDKHHESKGSKRKATLTGKLIPIKITLEIGALYSIQVHPTALWVSYQNAWYSWKPSQKHTKNWLAITNAIQLYFEIADFFEDVEERLHMKLIDQIYQITTPRVAQIISGRSRFMDMLSLFQENWTFLEYHIRGASSNDVPNDIRKTALYKWIARGCLLTDINLDGFEFLPDPVIESPVEEPLPLLPEVDEDTVMLDVGTLPGIKDPDHEDISGNFSAPHDSFSSSQPPKSSSSAKTRNYTGPHKGTYESPQYPQGLPSQPSYVDVFLVVMYHAIAVQRENKTVQNVTMGNITSMIYKDFSIKRNELVLRLMQDNSGAIYAALPPAYRSARIGQEIDALRRKPPQVGPIKCTPRLKISSKGDTAVHEKIANDQWNSILSGRETLRQRGGNPVSTPTSTPTARAAPQLVPTSRTRSNIPPPAFASGFESPPVHAPVVKARNVVYPKPIKMSAMYD